TLMPNDQNATHFKGTRMSAPTPNSPSETEITTADIAAAERLAGVSFTDAERALMLDESHARLAQYERLRALPLTNSVTPAFGFDPRPARDRPRAQPIRRDFPTQPWPEVERPSNLEDAAFWSVRQLGALLRT